MGAFFRALRSLENLHIPVVDGDGLEVLRQHPNLKVFPVDPQLLIDDDEFGSSDGGGEWRSLKWSSHLLSTDERSGTRKRPYARALSVPLMYELSLAFGVYFASTPLAQFRGSHTTPE
ncbi:hypothetical protein B0H13DRAFT_1904683 [Mycena leptocephala]|nr:hypothetical protein B0H13DRAFT_1904683 [Mycena leptocephala]